MIKAKKYISDEYSIFCCLSCGKTVKSDTIYVVSNEDEKSSEVVLTLCQRCANTVRKGLE